MTTTHMGVNLYPGKRPTVVYEREGATAWIEIRDEDERELLCLFLNEPLIEALGFALATAKAHTLTGAVPR